MRLPNQILDAYDAIDAGMNEDLVKLAGILPDLHIKSAEERDALKPDDFALSVITKEASVMNKFPIATEEDTFLSGRFFDKNAHKLPREAAEITAYHIKKACEKFELPSNIFKHVDTMAKEASDNVYYEVEGAIKPTIMRKVANLSEMAEAGLIATNTTFAQGAFSTPKHVDMGCKYFSKYASKMPLEVRQGYAEALQNRAGELGMDELKGEVAKYASDHYSSMVGAHIRSRASLLDGKAPILSSALTKLAAARTQYPPCEFAKALHTFDKHAGLTRYYGGHLTDPYLATFATAPDKNAGYRTKTASGSSLNADQLGKFATAKYAKIKDYFGASLADEFKKEPISIFESLPMDTKEILVGIADGTL